MYRKIKPEQLVLSQGNCAIFDESMKLLTNVNQGTVNNFGHGGMAEMSYNRNKHVLRKMLTSAVFLSIFFLV